MDAPEASKRLETRPANEWPSVHGALAALFEAMGAPAGAFHIRALQVVEPVLQYGSKHSSKQNPYALSTRPGVDFSVVGCVLATYSKAACRLMEKRFVLRIDV